MASSVGSRKVGSSACLPDEDGDGAAAALDLPGTDLCELAMLPSIWLRKVEMVMVPG